MAADTVSRVALMFLLTDHLNLDALQVSIDVLDSDPDIPIGLLDARLQLRVVLLHRLP